MAPPLPDPPRELTPRVRRRAWTEPHVRFWWMLSLALLLIGAYVAVREWRVWSREVRLIKQGRVVDAEITSAGGLSSRWQQMPPDSLVTLEYAVDGTKYQQSGYLKGRKDFIQVRGTVPIRIDAADPSQWTARTEPPSMAQQLTGPAVVLPAFVVMGFIALIHRARLLRTWRDGTTGAAVVVEARQTALAPRSRLVRCTPADAADKRIINVFVSHGGAAAPRPGDVLWLIFPPGGRGRPVAAAWLGS
jgi:hypothetical protein